MKRRKRPPWWPEGDVTCPSPDMPEFDVLPWPEQVPFLTAEDLAVEASDDSVKRPDRGNHRFTLGDWVSLSFPRATCAAVVIEALLNCLGDRLKIDLHYHHMSEMPRGGTLRILASVWNEVMRILGYEPDSDGESAAEVVAEPEPPAAATANDSLHDILSMSNQLVDMAAARQRKPRSKSNTKGVK